MKIAVVIVTYNRLDCLKNALSKYENQTLQPCYMIVVDNASTDGTYEFLEEWLSVESDINKIVVHNPKNTGGSGGFYLGLKESLKYDYDFVFLADDDAYAESDTFEKLFNSCEIVNSPNTAALCTTVINKGKIDISHRCRIKTGIFSVRLKWIQELEYNHEYFKLDIVTFVGAAIKKSIIEKVGLPLKEYFIYYDDTEYFMRINEVGNTFCITKSRMIHDTDGKQSINSWKGYYDTRNWIDAVSRHFSIRYLKFATLSSYIRRCTVIAYIFRGRDYKFRKMCKIAIKDAKKHNLGISKDYYPGKPI